MSATEKVNILLVDDRRENLLALEGILKGLNENLVKVSSGVETLKYLLRNEVAVILPDVLKSKVSAFVQMYKQRREAQRQSELLKAERDFVTAVLDTVASFVIVLDSDCRIVRVKRSWEGMTGYSSDE